jgi:GT2 family glycosyltransferase
MQTPASADSSCDSPTRVIRHATSKAALILILLLPLDVLVATCLVAAELAGRLWRRMAELDNIPEFAVPKPECSFVLVSWNSHTMLEQSLPALFEALKTADGAHEVIVVDNHSTDGTEEFIRRRFPQVRLVSSKKNLYFGAGTRLGIEAATRDILVLMNSDTIVQRGFLQPLLAALARPSTFGVASRVCCGALKDCETGNTSARFSGNGIEWKHNPTIVRQDNSHYPVLWLHRGLFAVDRRKYLWLGGFDSLYDPLFVEDVDLSYRAWKASWSCLLAVQSKVSHKHELGTPAAGEGFLHMLVRRNEYIFFWKNINSLSMLMNYCVSSTRRRIKRASIPEIGFLGETHSFFAALKRLPAILSRRLSLACRTVRSDEEVFALASEAAGNQ